MSHACLYICIPEAPPCVHGKPKTINAVVRQTHLVGADWRDGGLFIDVFLNLNDASVMWVVTAVLAAARVFAVDSVNVYVRRLN